MPRPNAPGSRLLAASALVLVASTPAWAGTLIFADGFEAGHAGAWSSVIGGVTLTIESTPEQLTGVVFETVNVTTTIDLSTALPGPFTINLSQLFAPQASVQASPALPASLVLAASSTRVFNQEIEPQVTGNLEIETSATLVQTATTVASTVSLRVRSSPFEVTLNTPGSDPASLPPNTTTDVTFVVIASDFDPEAPPEVFLQSGLPRSSSFGARGTPLQLNDQGTDGDLGAGDGVYSGTTQVATSGLSPGDCLTFHATADASTSPAYDLCVSNLPIVGPPSDLDDTFEDPSGGGSVVRNEAILKFVAGTSESQMQNAVAGVGGSLVGASPGLGFVRAVLSPAPGSLDALVAILDTLAARPEVELAFPNAVQRGTGSVGSEEDSRSYVPNDTWYPTQNWLQIIRADEAWYLARGGPTIGVVDTGIDAGHPDFVDSGGIQGKVILGRDLENDDANPRDDQGHGTEVAGIAAAIGNNGTEMAGVAWASPILVIKVSDAAAAASGSLWHQTNGIAISANKGAKVIVAAFGGFGLFGLGDSSPEAALFCTAVDLAWLKGAVVVAAAGNESSSSKSYPAACPRAIAVGGTTNSDGRYADSNFGSWVDLAAPAVNVGTTTPTYQVTQNIVPPTVEMNHDLNVDGTSMSAPQVAGAAALLWGRSPGLSFDALVDQLQKTAKPLPGLQLGAGRLDVMEAVFNGSFEQDNLHPWQREGTASSITELGPVLPIVGQRFGFVSSGPAGAQVSGKLTQTFQVQPGVSSIPISFRYAFITEEYPEYVGSTFNDSMIVSFTAPGGQTTVLKSESVNGSTLVVVGGIDFDGGDDTVGWTTWRSFSGQVAVTPGPASITIQVQDAGDSIYDSVVVIDQLRFKP